MDETYEYKTPLSQRQYARAYYWANRNAIRLKAREQYRSNPEPSKARSAEYRRAHLEKYRRYAQDYNHKVREARKLVFEGVPKIEF